MRGPERIRTAVEAFAELCLAARPRDQFSFKLPEAHRFIRTAVEAFVTIAIGTARPRDLIIFRLSNSRLRSEIEI